MKNGIIKALKKAFHHDDTRWKKLGITGSLSLLHVQGARKELVQQDLVGAVLLLTMPSAKEKRDGWTKQDKAAKETALRASQMFAAETFCALCDWPEFESIVSGISVVNFLCIVLQEIEEIEEIVTRIFACKGLHHYSSGLRFQ